MSRSILLFTVTLAASAGGTALADRTDAITLRPGQSATLTVQNPTRISCEAAAAPLLDCRCEYIAAGSTSWSHLQVTASTPESAFQMCKEGVPGAKRIAITRCSAE